MEGEKQRRDRDREPGGWPILFFICSSIHCCNAVWEVGLVCVEAERFGVRVCETQRSGADKTELVGLECVIESRKVDEGGRTGTGRTEGGTREGEGRMRFGVRVCLCTKRVPEIVEVGDGGLVEGLWFVSWRR